MPDPSLDLVLEGGWGGDAIYNTVRSSPQIGIQIVD